jgi:hypothetical protein
MQLLLGAGFVLLHLFVFRWVANKATFLLLGFFTARRLPFYILRLCRK